MKIIPEEAEGPKTKLPEPDKPKPKRKWRQDRKTKKFIVDDNMSFSSRRKEQVDIIHEENPNAEKPKKTVWVDVKLMDLEFDDEHSPGTVSYTHLTLPTTPYV